MPWQMHSFTLVHTDLGNLPAVHGGEGGRWGQWAGARVGREAGG